MKEKKNFIADLMKAYDIKSAEDIQDALKDLLGGTIKSILTAKLDNHLDYDEYECSDNSNARNGKNKRKYVVNMEK